jgi:hypothetical protein
MATAILCTQSTHNTKGGSMISRKWRRLFTAKGTADDGRPVRRYWITGTDDAALIDAEAGRLFAYIHHDGYGKYQPSLTLSATRAARLMRREFAMLASLRSFPRVTVELVRIKADQMSEAQRQVDAVLHTYE